MCHPNYGSTGLVHIASLRGFVERGGGLKRDSLVSYGVARGGGYYWGYTSSQRVFEFDDFLVFYKVTLGIGRGT